MDIYRARLVTEGQADQVVEALSKMRLHSLWVLSLRKDFQLGAWGEGSKGHRAPTEEERKWGA